MAEERNSRRTNSRIVNYDAIAHSYDRRYQLEREYSEVESCLSDFIGGSDATLEVGCGTGHWLTFLSKQVPVVVGIDPSSKMLERARLKARDVRLTCGRAEALPFASHSFDRIFCINAFHHFSDKEDFVKEAQRVLVPKGGLLIMGLDPHTGKDSWWIYDYFDQTLELDKKRYPSTKAIRELMSPAGFLRCATEEVRHLATEVTASEAEEMGVLEQSSTSQLAILRVDEFTRGMDRLRRDIEAVRRGGDELLLREDLKFYATTGWLD